MRVIQDLRVLTSLISGGRGADHVARLQAFYSGQANHYDAFRKRLLTGRELLVRSLPCRAGDYWVEMGGGTGANLEFIGPQLSELGRVEIVDLCEPLLEVARDRIRRCEWRNVQVRVADATTYKPLAPVDVVLFSYSLTMIPDWYRAMENAYQILRPGGYIGVVDFYVSRKYPATGHGRHGWSTRWGWPAWFAYDDVFLSPDHLPMLSSRFQTVDLIEGRAKVPYLPMVRVPVYQFVGRKPL